MHAYFCSTSVNTWMVVMLLAITYTYSRCSQCSVVYISILVFSEKACWVFLEYAISLLVQAGVYFNGLHLPHKREHSMASFLLKRTKKTLTGISLSKPEHHAGSSRSIIEKKIIHANSEKD